MYTFHHTGLAYGARKPGGEGGKMGSNALSSLTDKTERKRALGLLLLSGGRKWRILCPGTEGRWPEVLPSRSAKAMVAYAGAMQTAEEETCFPHPADCISQYVLYLRHMGATPKYIMFYIKIWVEFCTPFQCFNNFHIQRSASWKPSLVASAPYVPNFLTASVALNGARFPWNKHVQRCVFITMWQNATPNERVWDRSEMRFRADVFLSRCCQRHWIHRCHRRFAVLCDLPRRGQG